MTGFIAGLLVMGDTVIALFFMRFYRRSGDKLFVYFSLAFALLALQRLGLALQPMLPVESIWLFVLRLFAFLLLLGGIIAKNRAQ